MCYRVYALVNVCLHVYVCLPKESGGRRAYSPIDKCPASDDPCQTDFHLTCPHCWLSLSLSVLVFVSVCVFHYKLIDTCRGCILLCIYA